VLTAHHASLPNSAVLQTGAFHLGGARTHFFLAVCGQCWLAWIAPLGRLPKDGNLQAVPGLSENRLRCRASVERHSFSGDSS
jgi:hypothetical protein